MSQKRYKEDKLMYRVGRTFAEARAEANLTQGEVAKICGIHQSSLSRLEQGNGNATIATLESVANALGCRIEVRLTHPTVHKE